MTNKFISKSVSRYFAIQIFYTLEFSYDFKETLNGFLEENKIDIHLTFKKKVKKIYV